MPSPEPDSDTITDIVEQPASAVDAEPDAASVAARTRATFALLRRLRRDHRREQASSMAFTAYVSVIALFVYGGLLLPWLRRLSHAQHHTQHADRLLAAAPPALVAVVLLLLLAVLRDALWRGPVTLPLPSASWLLPLPIDRGRLLRPRLRAQLIVGAGGGAVLGAVLAVVLATGGASGDGFWPLLGSAVLSFALTGLLAFGAATLVERYPGAGRLVRLLAPAVVTVALALAVQSALSWTGHDLALLGSVETWTGPWGWAVQPVLAGAGASAGGWQVALAGLAVLAVVLVVLAVRVCASIPGSTIRARARSMSGVSAGLTTLNPRAAAMEVRAARSGPVRALRLPRPHHAGLAVPWRDATALIRTPSRPAWAAVLTAVAFLFIALSVIANGLYLSLALLAGGLIAGYLAVTQLTEPARLDADDPTRAGHLPYPFDRLALRHAIVPLAVAGVLAEAGAAVGAALTGSPVPLLLPLVSVPALVAAAMVSAYRGPVPGALMLGMETPAGNTGLLNVIGWYAAGPLVAVVLLLPPMHIVANTHAAPGTLVNYVLWGLAVAAILTFWAQRRATARVTATRPDPD